MMPTTLATRSRNESNENSISFVRERRRRIMGPLHSLASGGRQPPTRQPDISLSRHHRAFLGIDGGEQRVGQVERARALLVNQEADADPYFRLVRQLGGPAASNQVLYRAHQR